MLMLSAGLSQLRMATRLRYKLGSGGKYYRIKD